ncbi:MAG: YlxR family protein [Actinomycetota bacterium]
MVGVPVRTCAGCRSKRPQTELIRAARTRAGRVAVDVRGSAPGRGAYLCPEPTCIDRALGSNRLRTALRHEGALPEGLRAELMSRARTVRKEA